MPSGWFSKLTFIAQTLVFTALTIFQIFFPSAGLLLNLIQTSTLFYINLSKPNFDSSSFYFFNAQYHIGRLYDMLKKTQQNRDRNFIFLAEAFIIFWYNFLHFQETSLQNLHFFFLFTGMLGGTSKKSGACIALPIWPEAWSCSFYKQRIWCWKEIGFPLKLFGRFRARVIHHYKAKPFHDHFTHSSLALKWF